MVTAATLDSHVAGTTQLVIVQGAVDRDAAREIDFLTRHGTSDVPGGVVIDLSYVDEISGALIGALLGASRGIGSRLTIVCPQIDLRRRLEAAGLEAAVTSSLAL